MPPPIKIQLCNNMISTWLDAVSSSIVVLYALPLILYFITFQPQQLMILLGMILTLGIGESIKHFLIGTKSPRPEGASDCNLFCTDGPQGGRPGMPSTHTAVTIFAAAAYFSQLSSYPLAQAGIVGYAVLMLYSRYAKQCHTLPQIAMGALLGYGAYSIVLKKCMLRKEYE